MAMIVASKLFYLGLELYWLGMIGFLVNDLMLESTLTSVESFVSSIFSRRFRGRTTVMFLGINWLRS